MGAARPIPSLPATPAAQQRRPEAPAEPTRLTSGELERELAVGLFGPGQRVLTAEAGIAVIAARAADRLIDALEREVVQRVGAQLGADLRHRSAVGDHLLARGHVDPVVARMLDRRRRDPQVHLGGAGVAQHLHDLAGRVAPHDRVVDDDQALAATTSGSGLNFSRTPWRRSSWPGWMKVRAT